MYDANWRVPTYKANGEDDFILPFNQEVSDALHEFVTEASLILEDFTVSWNKDPNIEGMYVPLTESVDAVKEVVAEIAELIKRLKDWKISFRENRRDTITGSEYWAFVKVLEGIRHRATLNSVFTIKKTSIYGYNYRKNIEFINEGFSGMNFAQTKAAFMQPLFAEIKNQRSALTN